MQIFRRIQGRAGRTIAAATSPRSSPIGASHSLILGGSVSLHVVGESYYQDNLRRLLPADDADRRVEIVAVLEAEIDNHYDPNAVSIWIDDRAVGHLSRQDAVRYRPGLQALEATQHARIGLRGVVGGDELLGVLLRHRPRDFGVTTLPPPRPHEGELRTGLSDAIASDERDDSYDLSWLNALPVDAIEAIARLRELLVSERDPIDRHFMFHYLEAALYRARNAIPSALAEFDAACVRHDEEMGTLRAAFIAKWGRVPWLQTYRQMCIREQKVGNVEGALWWAERGITVYGQDAARPEAVDDLHQRAREYRNKLGPVSMHGDLGRG